MKVCFISPKSYPLFDPNLKKVFGGAEVQMALLAKWLAKDDRFACSVIVGDYEQKNEEFFDGVRLIKSFKFSQNFFIKFFLFIKAFIQSDAEVYVQRSLSLFSPIICLLCKINKRKFIYMVAHDDELKGAVLGMGKLEYIFSKKVFKMADKVVVQNYYQENEMEKLGISSFILRSSKYVSDDVIGKKRKEVLWVGRSEKWKRPEIFIEVARRMPEISFVMIFPKSVKDDGLFKLIKSQAKSEKNILFLDYVKHSKMEKYFSEAMILLNTSIAEGFPNIFLEAAITKTFIISTNVNPDNFLSEGRGVVSGEQVDDIVKEIKNIFKNEKFAKIATNVMFEYVKNNYNIKVNSEIFKKELLKLKL